MHVSVFENNCRSPGHPKQQQNHACLGHKVQNHQLVQYWHSFTGYRLKLLQKQAKKREHNFSSIKSKFKSNNIILTDSILSSITKVPIRKEPNCNEVTNISLAQNPNFTLSQLITKNLFQIAIEH